MKRILLATMLAMASMIASALNYEDARQQAWFLTDKMAYELNLTQMQYDRAYQINLDYFLQVATPADLYGYYWRYRDEDLRFILDEWQYRLYTTIDYFFRPVRWISSRWYYPVFDRYRRNYYYYAQPTIYVSYRGGFGFRGHNRPSPYRDMRPDRGPGMRDGARRGWGDNRNPGNSYNRPGGRDGGQGRHDGWNNGNRNGGSVGNGGSANSGRRPNNGNVQNDQGGKSGHGQGTQPQQGNHKGGNQGGTKPAQPSPQTGLTARQGSQNSRFNNSKGSRSFGSKPSGTFNTQTKKSTNSSPQSGRGRNFGH